jgi:VanZ family protein
MPIYRPTLLLQFWILLIACLWLSLIPQPPGVFELASDKLWHTLAYLVLYLSCSLAYRQQPALMIRFALLFSYSLVIEVIQHFIPNRSFSLLDLCANAAGLLLGIIIHTALLKHLRSA